MKRRSERLHRVFRVSETREKAEGRTLAAAQRTLDEARTRLAELEAYRKSYGDLRNQPRRIGSMQWKDYQSFLARLDEAIAVQARVVQEGRGNVDVHRRRWLARRREAESLERVVARAADEENAERELRIQKASDELGGGRPLFACED